MNIVVFYMINDILKREIKIRENETPTIEEIIYHLAEKFAKES